MATPRPVHPDPNASHCLICGRPIYSFRPGAWQHLGQQENDHNAVPNDRED